MANRYWVGGTASWDGTAGTKWASTSGGTGGEAIPTASDDVFFDANSGTVTVTIAAGNTGCLALNFAGFTGTLAGSTAITVTGSITLASAMTWTHTGTITMNSSTSVSITSNGRSITSPFDINGTGTFAIADSFTTIGTFLVTKGTLTLAADMSCLVFYSTNTGNTRAINLGSYTLSISFDFEGVSVVSLAATNLTFNPGTSTIKMLGAGNIQGGGLTYNNFWIAGSRPGNRRIVGSNTFNDFKDDVSVAHSIIFSAGTTQTVSTFTVSGTAGNLITINSESTSTHTLTKSGGGTITCDYLNIQHSIATPANTWYPGANSVNNQATATAGSGWVFESTTDIKSVDGVAYASIKSMDQIAIASVKNIDGIA